MNTDFIKGVVVPILTPIDENEKIDEARLRDQVDYVIEGGVLGILAFGSNGEFYMVEEDEMERGLKIMLDQAAGRVPRKTRWSAALRSCWTRQQDGFRFISESVPSAQRNAAGWRRWPWRQEQRESPFFSPCF